MRPLSGGAFCTRARRSAAQRVSAAGSVGLFVSKVGLFRKNVRRFAEKVARFETPHRAGDFPSGSHTTKKQRYPIISSNILRLLTIFKTQSISLQKRSGQQIKRFTESHSNFTIHTTSKIKSHAKILFCTFSPLQRSMHVPTRNSRTKAFTTHGNKKEFPPINVANQKPSTSPWTAFTILPLQLGLERKRRRIFPRRSLRHGKRGMDSAMAGAT